MPSRFASFDDDAAVTVLAQPGILPLISLMYEKIR